VHAVHASDGFRSVRLVLVGHIPVVMEIVVVMTIIMTIKVVLIKVIMVKLTI
jgi:hypothetical protein